MSINNFYNLSAGYNIWIGNGGQSDSTANQNNVAIGYDNMVSTKYNGRGNIAIGRSALQRTESGINNLAIGVFALEDNTSGEQNIAFGLQALRNNTSGKFNTAIGYQSLDQNTTGGYNTAIGTFAMSAASAAEQNTGIGVSVLQANVSGINNTGVANYSLAGITSGNDNVAIGFEAGYKIGAGTNNTSSSGCAYIGSRSKASASGNTEEIVIGYAAVGNGSNTTTIGNNATTHTVFEYGETLLGYSKANDKGAFRLQVDGEGYISTGFRVDYLGAFDANTIFQMPNTSTKGAKGYAWNTYSDARIKTSVSGIENALEKTMALRPVRYLQSDSYIEDGQIKVSDTGRNTIGFIAQEVEGIVPEAVQRGSDTELWGMDYTKLIPMLTKAIQEQQAQIEALKKEIEQLKNK